eukprot:6683253-Prymnesium_polylepis.1
MPRAPSAHGCLAGPCSVRRDRERSDVSAKAQLHASKRATRPSEKSSVAAAPVGPTRPPALHASAARLRRTELSDAYMPVCP